MSDNGKLLEDIKSFRASLFNGSKEVLENSLKIIDDFESKIRGIDYKECRKYCRLRYELYECKLYLQNKHGKQILNYVNPNERSVMKVKRFGVNILRSLYNKLPETRDFLVKHLEIYSETISYSKDDDNGNFYQGLKLCSEIEGYLYKNI